MANPAQSGSAFSQLHQIVALHGWEVMDPIIANATFVTSSKLAFQNVAKGEIALGLTSEFNVLQSKKDGNPVEAVYPEDGTALVVDAGAIIAGGPNPDAAKKFIDFVNSKPAHEMLVEIDGRRSARKDVTPPAGLAAISTIKVVPYDTVSPCRQLSSRPWSVMAAPTVSSSPAARQIVRRSFPVTLKADYRIDRCDPIQLISRQSDRTGSPALQAPYQADVRFQVEGDRHDHPIRHRDGPHDAQTTGEGYLARNLFQKPRLPAIPNPKWTTV